MKQIILSDLHGCYDETMRLLEACGYGSDCEIVGISDTFDKGPKVADLLKFFYSERARVRPVIGNHEISFLRFCRKLAKKRDAAIESKHGRSRFEVWEALEPEHIDWVRSWSAWEPTHGKSIVLHAGLESDTDLPAAETVAADRNRYSSFWYTRYLRDGRMVQLGHEQDGDVFWADIYDGRHGHVYYGHQPWYQSEPRASNYATGIDLGGVTGGLLCAAVLDETGVPTFKTVPCKQYAEKYRKAQ